MPWKGGKSDIHQGSISVGEKLFKTCDSCLQYRSDNDKVPAHSKKDPNEIMYNRMNFFPLFQTQKLKVFITKERKVQV